MYSPLEAKPAGSDKSIISRGDGSGTHDLLRMASLIRWWTRPGRGIAGLVSLYGGSFGGDDAEPAGRLVAATISYNVLEAIIALTEGTRVSSTALIGFGLDSMIEVSSAAAVAWQFAGRDPQAREKIALRIIAFSFVALDAYITMAVRALGSTSYSVHWGAGGAAPESGGCLHHRIRRIRAAYRLSRQARPSGE